MPRGRNKKTSFKAPQLRVAVRPQVGQEYVSFDCCQSSKFISIHLKVFNTRITGSFQRTQKKREGKREKKNGKRTAHPKKIMMPFTCSYGAKLSSFYFCHCRGCFSGPTRVFPFWAFCHGVDYKAKNMPCFLTTESDIF